MSETDEKRTWPISTRLKQARAASQRRLSQSALAVEVQALGLSYFQNGKASRLESGYAYATWAEVEAIARVLNVDPHWLANIEKPVSVPKAQPAELLVEAPRFPAPAKAAPAPKSAPAPAKPTPAVSSPPPRSAPATPPVAPPLPVPTPAPPTPPPPPELAPFPIPPQGSLTVSDYRSLLGIERRKAEEAMGQKGLPAAEWRRWREYSRNLNEVLRSLY